MAEDRCHGEAIRVSHELLILEADFNRPVLWYRIGGWACRLTRQQHR